jgi:DNA-binding LytR/AlgR family response regulator
MAPLRILTIDDEPLAQRRLQVILRNLPDVELVGQASGCAEGLAAAAALKPDLLLLDVQMRDGSGFDVVDGLDPEWLPAIIFVTAFDHYAVRAFDTTAVDYVLKPVQLDRLQSAIGRARARLAAADAEQRVDELRAIVSSLRETMRDVEAPRYETELWIRKNVTGFARVPVDSIEWVSSEDDYVRVHTAHAEYLMRGSIKSLESRVDPDHFIRIHRQTLVRKSSIKELRSRAVGRVEVILQSGEQLRAGRIYAKHLRRAVAEHAG